MGRAQALVAVLDQVQILDQQVAAPRTVAEQGPDLVERAGSTTRPLGNGTARRRPSPGWIGFRTSPVSADIVARPRWLAGSCLPTL